MERYGWTMDQISNMTWPQISMALEQDQKQGAAGGHGLSAKGHELQHFTGPNCMADFAAWNQRRQLKGKL